MKNRIVISAVFAATMLVFQGCAASNKGCGGGLFGTGVGGTNCDGVSANAAASGTDAIAAGGGGESGGSGTGSGNSTNNGGAGNGGAGNGGAGNGGAGGSTSGTGASGGPVAGGGGSTNEAPLGDVTLRAKRFYSPSRWENAVFPLPRAAMLTIPAKLNLESSPSKNVVAKLGLGGPICIYHGGDTHDQPDALLFQGCEDAAGNSLALRAGDEISASGNLILNVNGSGSKCAPTVVSVTLRLN